jgi:hypothetical protein
VKDTERGSAVKYSDRVVNTDKLTLRSKTAADSEIINIPKCVRCKHYKITDKFGVVLQGRKLMQLRN